VTDDAVNVLGEGWDHTARRVERADGPWVVKEVKDGDDATSVRREVAVMRLVAEHLPGRVAPAADVLDDRRLTYPMVPGVALIEELAAGRVPAAVQQRLARQLGELIAALAELDVSPIDPPLPVEDEGWTPWFDEVRATIDVIAPVLSPDDRSAVERFVDTPPPPMASELAFAHNDLGGEHVFVDPATWAITGIIDWTDAAVADPAFDVARLLRDLGATVLPAVLDGLGASEREALATRAWCAARLLIVEDLAYAIEHRPHLVEFERTNLHRLFTAADRRF
jgi:aminoglycoside phosphotransferase (APT) family kinase protein